MDLASAPKPPTQKIIFAAEKKCTHSFACFPLVSSREKENDTAQEHSILAAIHGGAPRLSCHLREKFPGLPLLLNFASFLSSSIAARSFCMISQDWSGRMGDL